MRKVKGNPELLLINPKKDKPEKVFNVLLNKYDGDMDKSISILNEMYDGKIITKKSRKFKKFEKNSEFKKALKRFKKFHGKEPDEIIEIDIPQLPGKGFLIALGKAVSESYLSDGVINGSSKEGDIYVHPYEGELPIKAVTPDGKMIITLPGNYRVSDWIRG